MSGFSAEEIKAEQDRRAKARTHGQIIETTGKGKDTTCLHCGSPMHSWDASDPENPLCDLCL